jgi:hypothetical protein
LYGKCGLDPKVFIPAYGLAENTLAVSGVIENRESAVLTVNRSILEEKVVKRNSDHSYFGHLEFLKSSS